MTKKINFEEIFDSLPESIIIIDKELRVLDINDNAESTFRISREKARGQRSKVFMPEEIDRVALMAMDEGRTVIGDEIKPTLRSGERISIQVVASPIFTQEGNLKGAILQIKDMSGTNFLNSKSSQETSATKFENLVLGLAHELKNPLSGIRGAAQLLAEDAPNKEALKCAQIITKEADRLRSLLDTLKQLEPFAEEVFELIDIHELLMEIIYLESMSKAGARLQYKQNYDVTIPPIHGDRNALKQVFLNIIKNAAESITEKGLVEISSRWITEHKLKGQNSMSIEIRDNGGGIPPDSLEKIFNPFYTTKKEGSGLGLFLAYQIIAKHGGAIFIDSEVGVGTAIKVFLPISGT